MAKNNVDIGQVVGLIQAMMPSMDAGAISSAVTSWLDQHPEATTTVADGSITEQKLASAVAAKLAEVTDLKSAVTQLETDVPLKVNKPTSSPNGTDGQFLQTNGDGSTVWADPFEEPVDAAVQEWLDDHPEATTTVQDGAITEAKISSSFLHEIKNNYVTPQMYGAMGDGSTDDTQALQTAFDSGFDVFIPTGTYKTSGVNITINRHVYCDNVTFKATTAYQDYVIQVTTLIDLDGIISIDGDYKALCGIKFYQTTGSTVGKIFATKCLAWGVHLSNCGHMTFAYVQASYCGRKMNMTVSYVSGTSLSIDDTLSDEYKTLLGTEYARRIFMYDKSGYTINTSPGKLIRMVSSYDAENNAFVCPGGFAAYPNDYIDKEACFCFGGGICIGGGIYTQNNFQTVDTVLNATGITYNATYGQYIGSYYSQSDGIPVVVTNYSLGTYYGSVTMETGESAYSQYSFVSYYYDFSVIVTRSTGQTDNYVSKDFYSISDGPAYMSNPFLLESVTRFVPHTFLTAGTYTITEQSCDVCYTRTGSSFRLNLVDKYTRYNTYNPWGVKTVYFLPSGNVASDITFTLHNDLISDGYTITGGTSGVITISRPQPNACFKVFIALFGKEFTFYMEEIQKVNG